MRTLKTLAYRHPFIVIFLGIACVIALFTVLGLDPDPTTNSCYPDCPD